MIDAHATMYNKRMMCLKRRAAQFDIKPTEFKLLTDELPYLRTAIALSIEAARMIAPKAINGIMRSRGISLRQFAMLCKYSPTYVSMVKSGKVQASPDFLSTIGKMIQCGEEKK